MAQSTTSDDLERPLCTSLHEILNKDRLIPTVTRTQFVTMCGLCGCDGSVAGDINGGRKDK